MLSISLLMKLLLTVALGVLLGMEREQTYSQSNKIAITGVRTFALIALFGFVAAMIGKGIEGYWFVWIALIVVAVAITLSSYFSHTANGSFWITTEIAALICFLTGGLVFLDYQLLAICISIITFMLMSLREQLHSLVHKVSTEEMYDTIKFAIIAFIVLPLLPNQDYGFLGLFNPYKTWLMVVFVSGIWFVWYILTKVVGTKKGIGLTGLIWGIVSSTAVTTSLSWLSKKAKNFNAFVFGVLVSSSIMFVRVWIYAFALNKDLFARLIIPLWVMAGIWLIISLWHYLHEGPGEKKADVKIKVQSPFALKPALFFGAFFAFIIWLSKLSLHYLPAESLYFVAFFSWFTDVDAITLSVSSLKELSLNTATIAIIIAVMVNTAVKWWIAFLFGARKFAIQVIMSISLVIVAGAASLFFL